MPGRLFRRNLRDPAACPQRASGKKRFDAQPTLSQQLGVMRRLKLVETRRAGKMVYYRIEDNRIMTLLNTLYDLYCPQAGTGKGSHNNE